MPYQIRIASRQIMQYLPKTEASIDRVLISGSGLDVRETYPPVQASGDTASGVLLPLERSKVDCDASECFL